MNVAEAEARVDGINFYVNDKNITVSARRVEGGGISIVRTNGIKRNLDVRVSDGIVSLIAGVIFFIIKMLLKDFGDFRLDGLIIICLFWGVIMTGYILDALNPKNEQEFKYHAAEHKVLNYWDKYQKITLNCEEIWL